MEKSIYSEDVKKRILEYIAEQHYKSLPKFLTEWTLQEYKEHEKKPFHRNLKNRMGKYKKKDTKTLKSDM